MQSPVLLTFHHCPPSFIHSCISSLPSAHAWTQDAMVPSTQRKHERQLLRQQLYPIYITLDNWPIAAIADFAFVSLLSHFSSPRQPNRARKQPTCPPVCLYFPLTSDLEAASCLRRAWNRASEWEKKLGTSQVPLSVPGFKG